MDSTQSQWYDVAVGLSLIRVNDTDPVATITRPDGSRIVVSWPDLDVGWRSPTVSVLNGISGAWVCYEPNEVTDTEVSENAHGAAVHITADGVLTRRQKPVGGLADARLVGVTRHGLWLGEERHDVDDEAGWLAENDLRIITPDGSTRTVTIDRRVRLVDDGPSPRLVVYAAAPRAVRLGRGTRYDYSYLQLPLPVGDLPTAISVDDSSAQPIDQDQLRSRARSSPTPRGEVPDAPRIRWQLVDLPQSARRDAVRAVRRQFDRLDRFWEQEDGQTAPIADGLSDPRVDVVGDWPDTAVEVSFVHPHYPGGRCRRTVRVFDDAGRVVALPYANISLMEDLDTLALPSPDQARGGVLEI